MRDFIVQSVAALAISATTSSPPVTSIHGDTFVIEGTAADKTGRTPPLIRDAAHDYCAQKQEQARLEIILGATDGTNRYQYICVYKPQ